MTVKNNFHIAQSLWYKIGGTAKVFLECKNREAILEAVKFIKDNTISKVFVCGMGSNLIFTDEYFDGAVINITASETKDVSINEDGLVEAYAGESLDSVIQFGFERNLIGLEWAGGLPGTVGAAVRGNVGAYGGEIKDCLVSCDVIDFSEETPVLKKLTNEDLQFVYRGSLIKTHKKMVVVAARFSLKKATEAEMEAATDVYHLHMQQRKDNHPLEYPNCGSVFKNLRDPQQIEKALSVYQELRENVETKWHGKVAAASLIEKLGLKGFRIGDAQVSEKHALFIVNLGNAKSQEVLQVIDTVQQKFQETFGFQLETEVEIVS